MEKSKKLTLVWAMALVVCAASYAAREDYSDGSYIEFEEFSGMRRWTHAVPVGGGNFRVQYQISEQDYNYGGFTFRGEYTRREDMNLDGATEYMEENTYGSNGALLISKIQSQDSGGGAYTQYGDSQPRHQSVAGNQDPAYGRAGIRIYNNGFCYVWGDGSCQWEQRCDVQIQNMNQFAQFRVVEEARRNRDQDPLAVKAAERRYERERAILAACKASAR